MIVLYYRNDDRAITCVVAVDVVVGVAIDSPILRCDALIATYG